MSNEMMPGPKGPVPHPMAGDDVVVYVQETFFGDLWLQIMAWADSPNLNRFADKLMARYDSNAVIIVIRNPERYRGWHSQQHKFKQMCRARLLVSIAPRLMQRQVVRKPLPDDELPDLTRIGGEPHG